MAYPGTNLYERLKSENRLNSIDPNLLNGIYPTIQFNNMSQTELYHKYFDTLADFFDYDHVRELVIAELKNAKFQREETADISTGDKFKSVFHLVNMYLLTFNKQKRKMFLDFIGLVRQGVSSINVIVEILLFISSFQGYLKYTKRHGPEILKKIEQYDRGPWANSEQRLQNSAAN